MNRPIALRAAADALANVGVTEEGENRGKWVETYLRTVGLPPGSPWCAAFVRFRFEQAAAALKLPLPLMDTLAVSAVSDLRLMSPEPAMLALKVSALMASERMSPEPATAR